MRQSDRARLSVPPRRLFCDRVAFADAAEARRPDRRQLPHGRADLRSDALRRRTRRPGDGRHAAATARSRSTGRSCAPACGWREAAAGTRLGRRRRRSRRPPRRARRSPRSAPSRRICGRTARISTLPSSFEGLALDPALVDGTHAAGVLRPVRPDDQRTASTCAASGAEEPARPLRHDPQRCAVGRRRIPA